MYPKYTDAKPDNFWLKTIANEVAETNHLLKSLIDSFNQKKDKQNDSTGIVKDKPSSPTGV